MVCLLYKHMHEVIIQCHCIIHERSLIGKTVGFKQIMTDVVRRTEQLQLSFTDRCVVFGLNRALF